MSLENRNLKISVVIPVYNRENTIERCLESVFNQTLRPLEIVIVDDGSFDNTVQVIKELQSESPISIVLVQGGHCGAQAARNEGIRNSKGEFIAFLDSDDEWTENWLSVASQAYCSSDEVLPVICAKGYVDNGKDRRIKEINGISGNVHKDLLSRAWPMFPAMFVKKECLEAIGLLDELCPAYQEWDTSISLSRLYPFIFVNEPMFIWHQDGSTETISASGRDVLGLKYIITKNRQEILAICGYRALANLYGRLSDKLCGYEWIKYKSYQVLFFLLSVLT